MASRKKDGGAQRAEARRKVANKKTEKKYGLEGFTKQAEKNLKSPILPTNKEMGAVIAGGAATQLAAMAANKVASKVGAKLGNTVANNYMDDAMRLIDKSKQGGRVFRTNTPMGPSLGSTKIMNAKQLEAAKGGLAKISENKANKIESNIRQELSNLVSGAIRATSRGANIANTKYQTSKKGRKNAR